MHAKNNDGRIYNNIEKVIIGMEIFDIFMDLFPECNTEA